MNTYESALRTACLLRRVDPAMITATYDYAEASMFLEHRGNGRREKAMTKADIPAALDKITEGENDEPLCPYSR